jgi:ribosomal protein S17E
MTPKEKAESLVNKYQSLLNEHIFNGNYDIAQQCALIAVDEILDAISGMVSEEYGYSADAYYEQVKQEIENL